MRPGICAALLLGWALLGCGRDNQLSGSVGELFPLGVSRVEVQRNDEALVVSYFANRGVNLDLVIRLSLATRDLELLPGGRVDLAGEYAPGHQRTTVIHAPGGEPARALPPVKKGDLRLSAGGRPDELTRGDFSMLFESTGGDLGQGRTLSGTFAGIALDAGFDPPPP